MIKICFTGHRPTKLGGYNWSTPKNQAIMAELRHQIVQLVNSTDDNKFTFYFGGALGIDQMAFNIVEKIKFNTLKLNPIEITQILAMPFEKQDNNWFGEAGRKELRHERLIANEVILVDTLEGYKIKGYPEDIYFPAKMQKRNEYMVNNSDIIIAVWDGVKRGGTYNCVKYAQKLEKQIIQINPKEIN